MHLPTARARRDRARTLDHITAQTRQLAGAHPREAAAQFLHDKIRAGQAGLDPYDVTILVVQVHAFERVWATRACELAGVVLSAKPWNGGIRIRAIVEADVRLQLGLDAADSPLMEDEPLASRAVSGTVFRLEPPALPLAMREPMLRAQHAAALRVDCACGAPAGVVCRCDDETRLTGRCVTDDELAHQRAQEGQVH